MKYLYLNYLDVNTPSTDAQTAVSIAVATTTSKPSDYGLTVDDLKRIVNFDQRTSADLLRLLNEEFGGAEGVARLLKSDVLQGLEVDKSHEAGRFSLQNRAGSRVSIKSISEGKDDKGPKNLPLDFEKRQVVFGRNLIDPPPSPTIFELVLENIKEDTIVQVLLVGAIVILIIGVATHPKDGWIEGLAIFIAVVIVLTVSAGNDYHKDKKFKKLMLLQSDKKTKVVRGGIKEEVSSWDLVVGDIVELSVGDEIPADGLFLRGNQLVVDESPLTGESLPVRKDSKQPFIFSGCQINEGNAYMVVTAVGLNSSGGQIQELLNESSKDGTPMQQKLKELAVFVGKVGVAAGALTFLGLAIRWAALLPARIEDNGGWSGDFLLDIVKHFVLGVTIVVVAVPEGLPLAVTISLAFSMMKMIQDKCFVRYLDASETMGEATCICTDKTGTLTENRMTVVRILAGNKIYNGEGSGDADAKAYNPATLPTRIRDVLCEGVSINSTCFITEYNQKGQPKFVGSATEGSLLVLANKLGVKYDDARKNLVKLDNGVWTFNSERKRMTTIVKTSGAVETDVNCPYRIHTKGASEIVLELCTRTLSEDGQTVVPLSANDRELAQQKIIDWASDGLRTLVIAYRDTDIVYSTEEGASNSNPDQDLVFIGLVAIKDPLRSEVPRAVSICKGAGLTVRMVTGDNILTASKIAKECGIMYDDGIAMEGPAFRAMTDDERKRILPKLQVLARSSPRDKFILVSLLREMGEVVAVTGDGTNDAPALKEADVGFAMGISGTQIAMNASDIILLDDNFASIVNAIRWGRNVLAAVRKFLQFQLAVNMIAIIITFIGSISLGVTPLNAVQLLWVNLIMDSLGALALASDEPDDDILEKPPHGRNESILSFEMKQYIVIQVIYQTAAVLTLLYAGASIIPHYEDITDVAFWDAKVRTMVFSTFILLQLANETLARQLHHELNFVRGLWRNKLFLFLMFLILLIQVIVVQFGTSFVQTTPLTWQEWFICSLIAFINVPYTVVARLIVRFLNEKYGWGPVHGKHALEPRSTSTHKITPSTLSEVKVDQQTEKAPIVSQDEHVMPWAKFTNAIKKQWKTLVGKFGSKKQEQETKEHPTAQSHQLERFTSQNSLRNSRCKYLFGSVFTF